MKRAPQLSEEGTRELLATLEKPDRTSVTARKQAARVDVVRKMVSKKAVAKVPSSEVG